MASQKPKQSKPRAAKSKKQLTSRAKKTAIKTQVPIPDVPHTIKVEAMPDEEIVAVTAESENMQKSVLADTHAKNLQDTPQLKSQKTQKTWLKITGIITGVIALLLIVGAGSLGQFYKNRIMPGVFVAGTASGEKRLSQVEDQLQKQVEKLEITLRSDSKTLQPTQKEIGYQLHLEKTLDQAKQAKRSSGFLKKLAFWQRFDVPAVITTNDTLLSQYLQTHLPELAKTPVDARLQFDPKQGAFVITKQADGQSADLEGLKQAFSANAYTLRPVTIPIGTSKKAPAITEAKLTPLVEPANELTKQRIVLTGLGYTYQARPADIASWLTPTPQNNGELKLIVDAAKIQSYVDGISKRISSIPVDRKVIKDETTGAEVVIQEGRDGTELAGKQELSAAIATALGNSSGTTQTMNIQTAAFKTVNMNAFEKWIEVDLSEQRTTAYERTTPVKNFLIASGTRGHETVTGEFAIWHKNRTQTMQGGSKADGSYYSIPNVEWVSYFYKDYALHGAWWREKFGAPASHGCVNMTNADAQWVFEWAPIGTKVIVHQ